MTVLTTKTAAIGTAISALYTRIASRFQHTTTEPRKPHGPPPGSSADAATRLYNLANGARLRR